MAQSRIQEEPNFQLPEDNDDDERPCTVYLYRRKCSSLVNAYHWVLHFDWGDYSAHYEAIKREGILVPQWRRGSPVQNEKYPYLDPVKLGEKSISPQTVNLKARENTYNHCEYNLLNCNCQYWSQKLADMLGIKTPKPQTKCSKRYDEIVRKIAPLLPRTSLSVVTDCVSFDPSEDECYCCGPYE